MQPMVGASVDTVHTEQLLLVFAVKSEEVVVLKAPLRSAVLEQDLIDVEALAHPLPVLF